MATFTFTYVAPALLPVYEAMDSELLELDAMSELEACRFYKVDSKEEAKDLPMRRRTVR